MSGRLAPTTACALLSLSLFSCTTTGGGGENVAVAPAQPIVDPAPRPGAPVVLIAMPSSSEFVDVRRTLVAEIRKNFNVSTYVVAPSTSSKDFGDVLAKVAPKCVVVMNNGTVNLLREVQHARASAGPVPPTVVVMSSFLEELRPTLTNATGIAYEVPGVTAFINLRSISRAPLKRVGVVYRPLFRSFIERQERLAAREQIELVKTELPKDFSADQLRAALQGLLVDKHVDALWMLNDNGLIRSREFLDQSWRAVLRDTRVPLIVGVPNLIDAQSPLGSIAVVPDHDALGLQTANLIFDLSSEGWQAQTHDVELPLSVKTVVDVKQVSGTVGLKDDALRHIDKAVE
ncbi:MAG TPA: hypothetical protein VN903_32430 [Polyangia bacterium]|jgi:hypothetical protein|nr:hypothetical protein [Polyangia bacterium]